MSLLTEAQASACAPMHAVVVEICAVSDAAAGCCGCSSRCMSNRCFLASLRSVCAATSHFSAGWLRALIAAAHVISCIVPFAIAGERIAT